MKKQELAETDEQLSMQAFGFRRVSGANGRGSKSSPRLAAHLRVRNGPWKRRAAWLTLFCFFVSPATASFAGGTSETAIGNATTGDGVFTENTQTHTTFEQDVHRAVIQWDVMDQQADNTLRFVQNQGASVLNQASGISISVFRGRVSCDSSCVFANEAGVRFADGSYLDVGRLVAIAGNVSLSDFRAGDLHVDNIVGEVANFGEIHADSALLIGARITNGGEIYIADGTLTAVVGDEVWLREHDSNVVIHAALPEQGGGVRDGAAFNDLPAIDNWGTIDAGTGRVRLLAGDMLSFAIRNQGRIRAREIELEAGAGGLVEVSGHGRLDATNASVGGIGGTIKVLGDFVAIADEAVLDASGYAGGGVILVGGKRGGAAGTRTSQGTFVGKHTTLRADATHEGDGGKVIVWSDETTRSYGTITARGGVISGNGGFVETSGLEHLDVRSSPLIHARSGLDTDRGGEWLLDPFNIDIVNIVASCTSCLDDELIEDGSYDPDLIFSPTVVPSTGTNSEIGVGLIKSVLLSGADVTITTQGEAADAGDEVGNINFNAELKFDTGDALPDTEALLTLLAAGDININIDGAITNNDSEMTLNLDFQANSGQPELADDVIDYSLLGDLTIDADIKTGGGSVLLSGVNVNLNADRTIDTEGASIALVGGNVTVNGSLKSGGEDVFLQATRTLNVSQDGSSFSEQGGKVEVGPAGLIETEGGDVDIIANLGAAASADGDGETLVNLYGEIDTENPAGDRVGGDITITSLGGARGIEIIDRRETKTNPMLKTGGGDFSAISLGNLTLGEATINTRNTSSDPDGDGEIVIASTLLTSLQATGAGIQLLADSSLNLSAGSDRGLNLSIDTGSSTIILAADEINLSASDGQGGFETSQVVFSGGVAADLQFQNSADAAAPDELTITQDAAIGGDKLPVAAQMFSGADNLQRLTLQSSDQEIDLTGISLVSSDELILAAKQDIRFTGSTLNVASTLDLEVFDAFAVDSTLASEINAAATANPIDLSITAGAMRGLANSNEAGLSIDASLTVGNGASMLLRGGAGGVGDLSFNVATVPTLTANEITLWAGNGGNVLSGNSAGEPQVIALDADGVAQVSFDLMGADAAFSLRQSASITDTSIPNASQFVSGVDNLHYALRSDTGGLGGDDAIDNSKLRDTFLSLHAQLAIDPVFASGSLQVRGLDIGGLDSFVYTRDLNDSFDIVDFDIVDGASDTVLVIRAGLGGSGNLSFDGSLDEGEPATNFNIDADEIRLVAGDGLAGQIGSRIIFDGDADAINRPSFRGRGGDADPVKRFVFRQDEAIAQSDLPTIARFFAGVAPSIYAIHSDYDSDLDSVLLPSILLNDFDNLPMAASQLILSGEFVTLSSSDDLDLVSDFAQGMGPGFQLEIRADTLDLQADDLLDTEGSVPLTISLFSPGETAPIFTDFERSQDEGAEEAFTPALFDVQNAPATTPNLVSLSQEGDITKNVLTDLRSILDASGSLTAHDDPDDDAPLRLALDVFEGDIELDALAVAGMDLRIVLRAEDAAIDWNQAAGAMTYNLAKLLINADHSFIVGDTTMGPNSLEIISDTAVQLNAGNLGFDGDLGFGENVSLTANTIALRAGIDGQLASDSLNSEGEVTSHLPIVDLGNSPSFKLVEPADAGDPPNTVFEIRQDAGFVDDAGLATNGESLIPVLSPSDAPDGIGILRLVSDAGNITISDLAATFSTTGAAFVSKLDLQAGNADPLAEGTIAIQAATDVDTDLTLYDAVDLTAAEIILSAIGSGIVLANDPDVIFHKGASGIASDRFRFTIRHDMANLCEGAADCANNVNALPSLAQFDLTFSDEKILYTLESTLGYVELTSQIAAKLVSGSNASPQRVDLTLLGNGSGSFDVKLSAGDPGRGPDVQLGSLFVGSVTDPGSITGPLRILIADTHLVTAQDQTYYGVVEIDGTVQLTGDTLHFTDDITSVAEGANKQLTVNVREGLRIDGNINLQTTGLQTTGALRINLDPTSADFPRVEFGADGVNQQVTADTVEIFATPEAELDGFGGDLPATQRASTTATIGKRSGDLFFEVDKFAMSRGEKLSVGGALTIGALTIGASGSQEALIGDLSAVTIDVTASRIGIVRRSAGQYLGLDGSLESDAGVDLVANTIHLNGAIDLLGSGRAPAFGLLDPYTADANLAGFPISALNADNRAIAASDFAWALADAPPDLHPEGATRDDFSSVFFGKELVPTPTAWQPEPAIQLDETLLAQLEIDARADAPRAIQGRLERAGILDDVGSDLPDRSSDRVTVSVSRVLTKDTEEVVARFDRLFGGDGSRTAKVGQALQKALDGYRLTSSTRRVLGFEFRRYLRNRPSSKFDAYQALEDLDLLFSYHRNLGLTPGEYKRIQRRWLAKIKPDGISLEQFAEAIHPSRFVRGSDILELFGN